MSSTTKQPRITLAFTGKIDNGDLFIDISPKAPLTIELGAGELPPSVEEVVAEMKVGEQKQVRVSPEEGYGHRTKDLLHEVSKSVFGDQIEPRPGMILSQEVEKEGVKHKVPATVMEVKDETVLIDYNHPLAGHHLTYDLTVLDIQEPR